MEYPFVYAYEFALYIIKHVLYNPGGVQNGTSVYICRVGVEYRASGNVTSDLHLLNNLIINRQI